jgi:phytoene synthase
MIFVESQIILQMSNEAIEIKKIKFLDFQNNFNNQKYNDPIIKNMWQLIEEFNIPIKVVQDLLDGINSDIQENIKIHKKKDLLIYSYRVAGTVGLMMAKILRVSKKNSLKSAIDLGIAMQLTNISRDVVEDLNYGRSYIDLNFEQIRSTIKLSENYYENSFYSIKEIPFAFRFAILVARRVYRKIGYKILNKKNLENYKKSGKIYVSNFEKIIETLLSIFDLIKLSLISKNDDNIKYDHDLINEEIDLNERI